MLSRTDEQLILLEKEKFFFTKKILNIYELARGGGGCRCMSMPVLRDEV